MNARSDHPGRPGDLSRSASTTGDRRRVDEDRRGAGRVAATFAVSEADGARVHLCQAEDITTGGITIRHARGLSRHQPRTEVALRFALPGSREEIHARGEIVSDSRVGRFRRTGVRFIALRPEHEQLIATYCRRR
jgi:c-di-GMP-binding flagellar brake protein YcgR